MPIIYIPTYMRIIIVIGNLRITCTKIVLGHDLYKSHENNTIIFK